MNASKEIRCWAISVDSSLAASLLLGRASARAIAKAHLSELFRLVSGDREAAIAEISMVKSFGSRRLLLESFRLTFSQLDQDPRFHILLSDADLSQKQVATQYDQALLALLRDCNGKTELLANRVANYPVIKRKNLLQRLEQNDFKRLRRVKLNRKMFHGLSNDITENSPLSWWQWLLLVIVIAAFTSMFAE